MVHPRDEGTLGRGWNGQGLEGAGARMGRGWNGQDGREAGRRVPGGVLPLCLIVGDPTAVLP